MPIVEGLAKSSATHLYANSESRIRLWIRVTDDLQRIAWGIECQLRIPDDCCNDECDLPFTEASP